MYFIEKTCLYSSCDKVFITIVESRRPSGRLPFGGTAIEAHSALLPCLGSNSCQAAKHLPSLCRPIVHPAQGRQAYEGLVCPPQPRPRPQTRPRPQESGVPFPSLPLLDGNCSLCDTKEVGRKTTTALCSPGNTCSLPPVPMPMYVSNASLVGCSHLRRKLGAGVVQTQRCL